MEDVIVTVIGCGDAFASGGRRHTCFHVKAPHSNLLIDCGATAYQGLKEQGVSLAEIDTVVISHFHGDHYGGVPFLLLEEAIRQRETPLTIISPPMGKERINQLLSQLYPGTDVVGKLNLLFKTFVPDGVVQTDRVEVTAYPVMHTPGACPHGIRLEVGGKTISYSGDTEWTAVLITLARHADLFICECNFFDSEISGHLNYRTLQVYAEQLQCKRLLLTHLGLEMLQQQGNIRFPCAYDGQQIRL